MTERYAFTIDSGGAHCEVRYSARELRFLSGPLVAEGQAFSAALGLWENYTVSGGMDTGAWCSKPRVGLLEATQNLLSRIDADRDVLQYDYQYSFPRDGKARSSGGTAGFKVDGRYALVDARPAGHIYLSFTSPNPRGGAPLVRYRDIRREKIVPTDWGELKIYRRKAEVPWVERLPALVGFLALQSEQTLRIRHHYAFA